MIENREMYEEYMFQVMTKSDRKNDGNDTFGKEEFTTERTGVFVKGAEIPSSCSDKNRVSGESYLFGNQNTLVW